MDNVLKQMIAAQYKLVSGRDPDPEAAFRAVQDAVLLLLAAEHTKAGGKPDELMPPKD